MQPQWLGSTTLGLLLLGTLLTVAAVAVLVWPGRSRDIVYVVPPTQVPEVAAHLGVPVPQAAVVGGAGIVDPPDVSGGGPSSGLVWPVAGTPGTVSGETVPDDSPDDPPGGHARTLGQGASGHPDLAAAERKALEVAGPAASSPPHEWPLPVVTHSTATPSTAP